MALDGLLALLCAGAVVAAGPPGADVPDSPPPNNPDRTIATALGVQAALQQGREQLLHGNCRTAVLLLEEQLPNINGNKVYLKVLQDAYRGYIKELRLARQDAEAGRYLERLRILDPGADCGAPPAERRAPAAPAPPRQTIRAKGDDDPFQAARSPERPNDAARALLAQAEKKFGDRRYLEAWLLYEQACRADRGLTEACRERWAYCKLFHVVEALNQAAAGSPPPELEEEVRQAQALAPRLEFGNTLLAEIHRRQGGDAAAPPGTAAEAAVPVRHSGRNADGWFVTESSNFRIFHNQAPELAEKVAQVAEQTRLNMQLKWFGAAGEPWHPKCDIYLHATAADYSRATGLYNSPGHSKLALEGGRLVVRRIDLHCDERGLLAATLPHETTHIALASGFGPQLVPRWADEGMAVLTEPRERIERHLANLASCRQENQLFRLQDLVQMEDYPQTPRAVSAFYAQSVSLVEFLTRRRGAKIFTLFLNEALRYGYEKALARHYGYQSFAALEQAWAQYAFSERGGLAQLGEPGR